MTDGRRDNFARDSTTESRSETSVAPLAGIESHASKCTLYIGELYYKFTFLKFQFVSTTRFSTRSSNRHVRLIILRTVCQKAVYFEKMKSYLL
ncbi:hypothetical protein ALC60_12287 [Trachymyrmex zeteki]|uniref:Uncharacterized protein n=1 Tax=Mycetomoellerius zeteki TaxID=64791 RepID=A0A151WLW0_9HYME|nr:hypothetical protein ALC60_12287 [Trachymyrmex zeteki]